MVSLKTIEKKEISTLFRISAVKLFNYFENVVSNSIVHYQTAINAEKQTNRGQTKRIPKGYQQSKKKVFDANNKKKLQFDHIIMYTIKSSVLQTNKTKIKKSS